MQLTITIIAIISVIEKAKVNVMDKLQSMRVFVAVAEYQSFVKASEHLEISAPAVTRAIAQLEGRLGAKLFTRTTRHVRLTDAGQRFLGDAKRILDDVDEAEAAVSGSYLDPAGTISITAPILFGRKYVVPIIVEYLEKNPAVSVKLLLLDRVTHLMEEGLDLAIRIGHLEESNLYALRVGSVQRVTCGSPEYFAQHGVPKHPRDLANHDIVFPSSNDSANQWRFSGDDKYSVKVSPRFSCNQNDGAIGVAKLGWGITRVMSYQVGEEVSNGQLQRVLENYEQDILPVNIVHLEGRQANVKIRSFIDLALKRLRDNPFIN